MTIPQITKLSPSDPFRPQELERAPMRSDSLSPLAQGCLHVALAGAVHVGRWYHKALGAPDARCVFCGREDKWHVYWKFGNGTDGGVTFMGSPIIRLPRDVDALWYMADVSDEILEWCGGLRGWRHAVKESQHLMVDILMSHGATSS
eukprot:2366101-Amphidinium_carterae.2